MNTEKILEKSTPLPVPMVKETTLKEDGRFLIYYTFPPETGQASAQAVPEHNGGR